MFKIFERWRFGRSLRAAKKYLITRGSRDKKWLSRFTVHEKALNASLARVCGLAHSRGFLFEIPDIRLINPGIGYHLRRWRSGVIIRRHGAKALAIGGDAILFLYSTFRDSDQMELDIIMAHELGHIVDVQTKREGHPLFGNIGHLNSEDFANAFASFLYSKIVVSAVFDKIGILYDKNALVRVNLKIPE